jgi:ribosomal-protein-alanine N-acetyltransferase
MVEVARLETRRLILRGWREEDRAPFAALNADPEVMALMPSVLSRVESNALVDRLLDGIVVRGWGMFAVERREDGAFVGMAGLAPVAFEAEFTPSLELAWRLARAFWGQGYATEAAQACVRYGFDVLGEQRLHAFTAAENLRSQSVMQRIGMTRVAGGDFDHPRLPPGHRLRRHVLYRIDAE